MRQKKKPYRNPLFLNFCHVFMQPAECCVCGNRPWEDLHHFGDDGGMGMKPSDLEVARLCPACHEKYPNKRRSLEKNHKEILAKMDRDAGVLARAWIEYNESVEASWSKIKRKTVSEAVARLVVTTASRGWRQKYIQGK